MGCMIPHRTSARPAHAAPFAALALVALLSFAHAQDLARHLPADTALALGAYGVTDLGALVQPLVDPWMELGVGPALVAAIGGAGLDDLANGAVPGGLDPEAIDAAWPPELEGVDPLTLIGDEAWLGLSVSPYNPLPALLLLARVDGDLAARFDALLARVAGEPEGQALTEGGIGFVLVAPAQGLPLAAVRTGDLLALSTNPDVLRGVLRRLQGAAEPGFLDAPGVVETLARLEPGTLYGFLDLGPLARGLAPLAQGLGFDRSVARLEAMLETLGAYAGVTRIDVDGTRTATLRRLDGAGRDPELRALLTGGAPAPRDLLVWVPQDALSAQVTALDPEAWWSYVRGLVGDLTELGIPDLDRTLFDVLGVDVARDVLAWTAPGMAVVQTGAPPVAAIGAPAEDLLGQTVYVFRTRDAAAAEAGLARTLEALAQRAVVFADPFAQPGATPTVSVRERRVGDATVRVYDLIPGLTLATAVTADVALLGTTETGVVAVLEAGAAGIALPAAFAALLPEVPADARAFVLGDDRATLGATGDQLAQAVQLLAGFAGGGVDFAAIDRATAALDAYLAAIAPRFGGSVSWTRPAQDGVLEGAAIGRIDLR